MTYDALCATVGALRDRVSELEAKEAARAVAIPSGLRPEFCISLSGAEGDQKIQEIADAVAEGMERGMTALPPQTDEQRATINEWLRRFPSLNCRAFPIPPAPLPKAGWPKF